MVLENALLKSKIPTPLGEMIIIVSEKGLCFLEYTNNKRDKLIENRLKKYYNNFQIKLGANEITKNVAKQLSNYFNKLNFDFSSIPMDVKGSEFEKNVWKILIKIPYGKLYTYKQVAEIIGKPKASRAVGGASRRNPTSIIVPCHRVVSTSGSLTGYGGGLKNKQWLIEHEM